MTTLQSAPPTPAAAAADLDVAFEYARDGVRVELEWIGEGWGGDFDSEDPEDERLLRFTVCRWTAGQWEQVDDASYCTALPASIGLTAGTRIVLALHTELAPDVRAGNSIKRRCERLSWLSPRNIAADGTVTLPS